MTAPTAVDLAQHRDRCKSCHVRILWAITVNDERMPVDEKTAPNGNVFLAVQGGHLRAAVLNPTDAKRRRATGLKLRLPHHSTCPNANQYRRTRR